MLLVHSFIERRDEAFHVVAAPNVDLRVNDVPTSGAPLRPGDRISVGPYEVTVEEPPPGKDLALAVTLTRPLGNAFAELMARSQMELVSVGLGKRGWSWLLVVAVMTFSLGLPLVGALQLLGERKVAQPSGTVRQAGAAPGAQGWLATADRLWLSGAISAPHRYFAADCGACHQRPFVQVQDGACLECHRTIEHHVDPNRFSFASFEAVACQSCHKEHNGIAPIVLADQALCVACHAKPEHWETKTESQSVGDFGTRHPEFRPTVVANATVPVYARQRLDGGAPPQERSGLNFPHAKHLDEKGVKHPTEGTIRLACADCHRPEPGGLGMLPIRMVDHCRRCHALTFDRNAPQREVPHGKPREVRAMLDDFYAHAALKDRLEDLLAGQGERRLPRSQASLSREEAAAALEGAQRQAREVAAETIGKRVCKTCHTVIPPRGDDEPWSIEPVLLADRWLPHAKFNHAKHELVECGDCHAARQSKSAQDVLLPGVTLCQSCHGGEASADKVPSTCITCHDFHRHGLPPMRGKPTRQS